MRSFLVGCLFLFMSACTTEYVIVDDAQYDTSSYDSKEFMVETSSEGDLVVSKNDGELISSNDVFVVGEGDNFVTYQYKSVRVDEISPLASMYCADIAHGKSPYLREVSLYHNGFMRATFDCVSVAI